ncbi:MAG: hypothetical protein HN742_24270 [Lentisphaerae bacterium]|jgi:group II intron reverse transcriptase/maturase|nr:hypothetical protein [Lentisphaerota bacterium]MBT5608966.1 hypothetical protein [Lentisphaerota bacterium]MBT7061505.1 hypothetical protein [Lentisphaerota bacterium]MBT7845015.1 hypothetical protein [Lentisphaerota bacterium]
MTTTDANELEAIFTTTNLLRAWENVAMKNTAPGIDGVTVETFSRNQAQRLGHLRDRILTGRYEPQPYIVFPKEKRDGGIRELVNATVGDKVVARTAATELVRRYDRSFEPQSYAYRPGRGALKAVSAVERHCPKASHAVRADILAFFDEMDHATLRCLLLQLGESEATVDFLMRCVDAVRFDGVEKRQLHRGVPQGSPLAPILSNIYLHPLDTALNEGHFCFARYADDLVVLAGGADQANGALARIQEVLSELKLRLSIDKTRVYPVDQCFPFLGFLFSRDGKTPCQEARKRVSERLQEHPHSDESDSEYKSRLSAIRRGWKNYFGEEPETVAPAAHIDVAQGQPTPNSAPPKSTREGSTSPSASPRTDSESSMLSTASAVNADTPACQTAGAELAPAVKQPWDELAHSAAGVDTPVETTGKSPCTEGMEAAIALRDSGRYGEAISHCRRLLNREDIDIADGDRRAAFSLLGELYEQQGLIGAARRCWDAAGVKRKAEPVGTVQGVVSTARMVGNWVQWFAYGHGSVTRQYVDSMGRHGYRPASKTLNARYLRDHWEGRHTLAVPVFGKGDHVAFAVIDLDVSRRVLDTLTQAELQAKRVELLDDALGLVDVAHRAGVDGVIEDSGCKGYHVWFFLRNPVSAKLARHFLAELCRVAGDSPGGTHRELLPGSDTCPPDGNGARIKLPLGIHRLTGTRCGFINPDGSSCTPVEEQQVVRGRTDAGRMRNAIEKWTRWQSADQPPRTPQPHAPLGGALNATGLKEVRAGCAVLRALQRKASETHDLSHHERTVLRGILAPLGPAGHGELHRIVRHCRNYDRRLTDRMIGSAGPKPLGCRRIKEILGPFADEVGCACHFKPKKGEYAHPLRHVEQAATRANEPPAGVESKRERNGDGRCEAPAAGRGTGAPSPAGTGDARLLATDAVSMLLHTYHARRADLLEIQGQLQDACDRSGQLVVPFGTLCVAGPDPELQNWVVRL